VATPGWRTDFLTRMGFAIADTDEASISRDRMPAVLGSADVLIWMTESDEEQATLLADPAVAQLGAKRNVFTGKELAGAIAFASPLSYPLVADQLPAGIARALA
jgi:iron complex transport system substrate-binding protein